MTNKIIDKELNALSVQELSENKGEIYKNYKVSEVKMKLAELKLFNSLNDEQKKLYNDFCEKREEFYKHASKKYKKRF